MKSPVLFTLEANDRVQAPESRFHSKGHKYTRKATERRTEGVRREIRADTE